LQRTEKPELIRAIAYLTWPSLAAPDLAPVLGALLTERFGWPAIFLVNVPLGGALLLAALRIIPPDRPATPEPFDAAAFRGVAGTTLALPGPLRFQVWWGWSAVRARVTLSWLFVGNRAIRPLTTPLLRRFGHIPLAIAGALGVFGTVLAVALLGPQVPELVVV